MKISLIFTFDLNLRRVINTAVNIANLTHVKSRVVWNQILQRYSPFSHLDLTHFPLDGLPIFSPLDCWFRIAV